LIWFKLYHLNKEHNQCHMLYSFFVQWFEVRGGCSFWLYWWYCWLSMSRRIWKRYLR
jgi:hypothetical protein